MNYRTKQIIEGSAIIGFLMSINKSILSCFYESKVRAIFLDMLKFTQNRLVKNRGDSVILRIAKKISRAITIKDAALFITLAVIFSMLITVILEKCLK